jgi:hypothetical protein
MLARLDGCLAPSQLLAAAVMLARLDGCLAPSQLLAAAVMLARLDGCLAPSQLLAAAVTLARLDGCLGPSQLLAAAVMLARLDGCLAPNQLLAGAVMLARLVGWLPPGPAFIIWVIFVVNIQTTGGPGPPPPGSQLPPPPYLDTSHPPSPLGILDFSLKGANVSVPRNTERIREELGYVVFAIPILRRGWFTFGYCSQSIPVTLQQIPYHPYLPLLPTSADFSHQQYYNFSNFLRRLAFAFDTPPLTLFLSGQGFRESTTFTELTFSSLCFLLPWRNLKISATK